MALDARLVFYNDIFAWARVAFQALTGRDAPDILYGPSPEGDQMANNHRVA